MLCYCQSGRKFNECCASFIQGERLPGSAEQLMRSRFSAYCQGSAQAMQYLAESYHPITQPDNPVSEIAAFAKAAHFIRLDVIHASEDSALPEQLRQIGVGSAAGQQELYATVHFKVQFILHDKLHLLEEISRFIRISHQWFYLDGTLTEHPPHKLSRNDSCPCRSGKKYKHCSPHTPAGQSSF